VRERRVEVGPVALNVAEGRRRGLPFVILHGGSASWRYGAAFIDLLVDRWRVVAPDFRGHGLSGHMPGRYTLHDYAEDTIALLEGVCDEPALLYGHSLGGQVALTIASQRPDLVRAVISGDIPFGGDNDPTEDPAQRTMNELWLRLAGRPVDVIATTLRDMPVVVPGTTERARAADLFGEDSPWFDFQALNLQRLDPDVLRTALAGPQAMLDGLDPSDLLRAIICPVLLLQADPERGAMLGDADVSRMLALLRDGEHLRLNGLGHELHGPADQAPLVLDAIGPFLSRVGAEHG
jgi:pimeloyl-ACP methyl ester carboxylesterase